MKYYIFATLALFLVLSSTALAGRRDTHEDKVTICHNGQTISVDDNATWGGHSHHVGDFKVNSTHPCPPVAVVGDDDDDDDDTATTTATSTATTTDDTATTTDDTATTTDDTATSTDDTATTTEDVPSVSTGGGGGACMNCGTSRKEREAKATTTATSTVATSTATTTVVVPECKMIKNYVKLGALNDVSDVVLIQKFLGLPVTGVYDIPSFLAVKNFQNKYYSEVVAPWHPYIPGMQATGYVYKSTKWKINRLLCPSITLPFPSLIEGR